MYGPICTDMSYHNGQQFVGHMNEELVHGYVPTAQIHLNLSTCVYSHVTITKLFFLPLFIVIFPFLPFWITIFMTLKPFFFLILNHFLVVLPTFLPHGRLYCILCSLLSFILSTWSLYSFHISQHSCYRIV